MSRKILEKAHLSGELLHPSEYVCAIELKGKDVTVTIRAVEFDALRKIGQNGIEDDKERVPILRFNESPKKLIINRTNENSLVVMYGNEAREWVGKRITLYPTKVKVGKGLRDAIRIREVIPAAKGTLTSTDIGDALANAKDNNQENA